MATHAEGNADIALHVAVVTDDSDILVVLHLRTF